MLQKILSGAGQKTHERFYGAVFTWNGKDYPCTHDDVLSNPMLITGGFSPDTMVTVTVRDELFGDAKAARPKKGQHCAVKTAEGKCFALQIGSVTASTGDVIQKFLCMDRAQRA